MVYVFGPVHSRRLGLSLGVDLIPSKTCTYDCIYCEVGKTNNVVIEPENFAPCENVLVELKHAIERAGPDTLTLAGSGEPTLYSQIDRVIAFVKSFSDIQVALLTNGSLLWKEEVRRRVLQADVIMPTLSTVFEPTFRRIHQPHKGLNLPEIIDGLKALRLEYKGSIFLEVVLLAGINDSEKELEGLKRVIGKISPDKIQLNTVARPPSYPGAVALDRKRLQQIKIFFGENAEIIAHSSETKGVRKEYDSHFATIIETVKRRPITAKDISNVLNISPRDTDVLLTRLLNKGLIQTQRHEGVIYYKKGTDGGTG